MGAVAHHNFTIFQKLCGAAAFFKVAMVTTWWDDVDLEVGRRREEEYKAAPFRPVLDGGAMLFRHDMTRASAENVLRHLLRGKSIELSLQTEMMSRGDFLETEAGLELRRGIVELESKHEREIRELQRDLEEAKRKHKSDEAERLESAVQVMKDKLKNLQAEGKRLRLFLEVGVTPFPLLPSVAPRRPDVMIG